MLKRLFFKFLKSLLHNLTHYHYFDFLKVPYSLVVPIFNNKSVFYLYILIDNHIQCNASSSSSSRQRLRRRGLNLVGMDNA